MGLGRPRLGVLHPLDVLVIRQDASAERFALLGLESVCQLPSRPVRSEDIPMSELMTVSEVAVILKVSEDTVLRRFRNYPGVLNLGSPEDVRGKKRAFRLLRIPRPVLEKFIMERTV